MTRGAVARLALFVAGLALVGGLATLVGAKSGVARGTTAPRAMQGMEAGSNGLATVGGGFRLIPERTTFETGRRLLAFRIVDGNGRPAGPFDLEGGVRLHLILIRRDLSGYQHLHPRRDGARWVVTATLPTGGAYRAFADFEVDGAKTVLGVDLFATGRFDPVHEAPSARAAEVDGFLVELVHGALRAGEAATLRFRVSESGRAVGAFDEYVGHRGHLVALHTGDLAYTHVHPLEGDDAGEIAFDAELAAPGSYRLFLQFKVRGSVHTAPFAIEVER